MHINNNDNRNFTGYEMFNTTMNMEQFLNVPVIKFEGRK